MALVAYGSSGDSDSDFEEESNAPTVPKPSATDQKPAQLLTEAPSVTPASTNVGFNLPKPKTTAAIDNAIDEEDDEFLRKKPVAFPVERPPPPPKSMPRASGPVKIMLPALASFAEHKQKEKPLIGAQLPTNKPITGLIGMLPKPKSMQFAQKTIASTTSTNTIAPKSNTSLVPDSISRPKKVIAKMPAKKPAPTKPLAETAKSDSDDSDAEDFFSLNTDYQLPEVSAAEIAAMVASKSAQMSKAARNLQPQQDDAGASSASIVVDAVADDSAAAASTSRDAAGPMNQEAIAALCGSRRAKRSRHAAAEMSNIIDISGDQVLPDRDEWLRSQLTSTTEYQPRGLVDGDPGAGTKRKHQITYLAHQAKANEQELQAMWAANRHTRRQTQNKYGF